MTHTSPGRPLRQRHVGLGGRQCAVHQHRRRESFGFQGGPDRTN